MRYSTPLLCLLSTLAATTTHGQATCNTAPVIADGTHYVLAVNGEAAPLSCTGGGGASNAVWYRYQAAEDLNLVISTNLAENAGVDTRIQVYTGTCGALVCVGGDDDSGSGYLSVCAVGIPAGSTYFIVFDNYWSSTGFTFTVASTPGTPWENSPTFTPINVNGHNALGVADMNGDGLDDLITVNSNTSVLFGLQQPDGSFSNVPHATPAAMFMPTWSFCVGDINGDGHNDMLYGGGSGATFMIRNATGEGFVQQGFPQYIFSQRTNMVDINNDGHLDAFVCHDVDANVRFINNGEGVLQWIQGGLGETCGNYGSIWTDINNDGLPDLFVAKCGCDAQDRMLFNMGDQPFQDVSAQNGLLDNHQSWSSAWGDFDNDGDMDVFIGSSSSNYHKLLRNDGAGNFTPVTAAFMETTGTIEWTTHDFDNDGFLDIMGGGRILLGNGDMTFNVRIGSVSNGPVGDLNNDGFLDYAGGSGVYLNDGNDNHWLKVIPKGVQSNTNGIGARVEVESPLGTQIRDIRSGDGFRYMSTLYAHFGLGADSLITRVTVYWPSGIVDVFNELPADSSLVVVEGQTISTGINEQPTTGPAVFPNPTVQLLTVEATEPRGQTFQVFDVAGHLALQGRFTTATIDVSMLPPGVYTLQLAGAEGTSRFVKQ